MITLNPASYVELPYGKRPKALLWSDGRVECWQHTGIKPSRVMVWTPEQADRFLDHAAHGPLWLPCTDGNLSATEPAMVLQPIKPGLIFHGLRHSHKTWVIADDIPEIAQARLGHVLEDKVQETYSLVASEVETRLPESLQQRWDKALANLLATDLDTTWRIGPNPNTSTAPRSPHAGGIVVPNPLDVTTRPRARP